MIFAHLLLNYDIKPLAEKPEKMWVIRFQVPSQTYIEVQRRKSAWTPEDRTQANEIHLKARRRYL
jgi:hypothetical protein